MFKKILVTVAGRGLCEQMVNMLLEIPSIQQASLTVLHVVPPQATAQAMSEQLEEGGKILAEAVQSIKIDDPSRVNPPTETGRSQRCRPRSCQGRKF